MPGAIRIGRLRAECEVAAGASSAAVTALGDVTRRAVAAHLVPTLRGAFGAWLDRPEPSVWVVRRVECDVHVGADAPPDVIASSLASALGRALGEALTGDGDGIDTIRFPSRAAYLARFVRDAASGDAGRRWYHAAFAGLAALPASAAIRTALSEDAGLGLAALSSLDDTALASVGAALTPPDERALLDALAAGGDGLGDEEAFVTAWSGCGRAWDAAGDRGRALFAYVRADGGPHGRAVAHAGERLLDAMAAASGRAASGTFLADASSTRADPFAGIPDSVARAARALVLRPSAVDADADASAFTRHGGVFLLLPAIDELPWDEWTANWPAAGDMRPADALRWLTAARCAGRAQAGDVLADGVVRALFGVFAETSAFETIRWLRSVGGRRRVALGAAVDAEWDLDGAIASGSPSADERAWLALPGEEQGGQSWRELLARVARLVLARFARRLPGFADSSPAHLWTNFLAFSASVEYGEERVVVRCGRPPLHLVLSLTGMTRGSLAGRDARGRDVMLYPGD